MMCSGSASHASWAMVLLLIVCASIFGSLIFSYLFLWTTNPQAWPAAGALPSPGWPMLSAAMLVVGAALAAIAGRLMSRDRQSALRWCVAGAALLLAAAPALDLAAHWQVGLRPQATAYTAATYAVAGLQALFGGISVVMGVFTVARSMAGRLRPTRRAAFDTTRTMLLYTVAQGLIALALLHGFPRLTG